MFRFASTPLDFLQTGLSGPRDFSREDTFSLSDAQRLQVDPSPEAGWGGGVCVNLGESSTSHELSAVQCWQGCVQVRSLLDSATT